MGLHSIGQVFDLDRLESLRSVRLLAQSVFPHGVTTQFYEASPSHQGPYTCLYATKNRPTSLKHYNLKIRETVPIGNGYKHNRSFR